MRRTYRIGDRYGRLVILADAGSASCGGRLVACRCDCGIEKTIRIYPLLDGRIVSCGCFSRERTRARNYRHGDSEGRGSPEYRSWRGMVDRCRNPGHRSYPRYGGRGITVCERWLKYENFLADMGRKPSPEYTLERENGDGNYEPDNVIWATPLAQGRHTSRNRRVTLNGREMTLSEAAELTGVNYSTAISRMQRGLSPARAFGCSE